MPLRPAQPGGYDVVMASEMLGILPPARVDGNWADAARHLADDELWRESRQAVERALAHETNHNVRFQFIAWRDDITLGEMMVSEELAENFSVSPYGEENAGPWVTKTSADVLKDTVKPAIRAALDVQGMAGLAAYLYGDEIAAAQGYPTVGLPYCAGYACGYNLVRCYLDTTGADIADATLLPAEVILQEVEAAGFWS